MPVDSTRSRLPELADIDAGSSSQTAIRDDVFRESGWLEQL
jgi:hypothetical protein